jgi:hypothetical protein
MTSKTAIKTKIAMEKMLPFVFAMILAAVAFIVYRILFTA